jgi:hypothetical protein
MCAKFWSWNLKEETIWKTVEYIEDNNTKIDLKKYGVRERAGIIWFGLFAHPLVNFRLQ